MVRVSWSIAMSRGTYIQEWFPPHFADSMWTPPLFACSKTVRTLVCPSPTAREWASTQACGTAASGQRKGARLDLTGVHHPLLRLSRVLAWTRARSPATMWMHANTHRVNGGMARNSKVLRPTRSASWNLSDTTTSCTTIARINRGSQPHLLNVRVTGLNIKLSKIGWSAPKQHLKQLQSIMGVSTAPQYRMPLNSKVVFFFLLFSSSFLRVEGGGFSLSQCQLLEKKTRHTVSCPGDLCESVD